MNYVLRKVTYDDKNDIIEYINEMYESASLINGVGRLQDYVNKDKNDFESWYKRIKEEENEKLHKTCYVLCKNDSKKIYGMVNIRIEKDLGNYEHGHIGYSIRPKERNKGLGKLQFYLALKELLKNNIDICQMACNEKNTYSRNIIKSLDGNYQKNIDDMEYYLIDIKKTLEKNRDLYENNY